MARKLRLEYAGAMYHVLNRGNYRADIFADDRAKEAFTGCLFEACVKADWRLHAYIVMRNHYHLALETPAGNLVEGMRWLQSTYANRFNRFRGEHGHVFQGRYHALLVENLNGLGAVGHYIHLNPVRAKFLTVEKLAQYRFSSYVSLCRPKERPAPLSFSAVLAAAGGLADTKPGWDSYAAYLQWLTENEPAQKGLGFERMCQGWALGSAGFKKELLDEHREKMSATDLEAATGSELRLHRWQQALDDALHRVGKTREQARHDSKGADWKVAVATHLKNTTTVSNPWLAEALHMGASAALSRYVTECRAGHRKETRPWHAKISKG